MNTRINFFASLMLIVIGLSAQNTEPKSVPVAPPDCKNNPIFMNMLPGINPSRAAISTSEKKQRGLVVVELQSPKDPHSLRTNTYQHPTWDDAGYLGSFALDYEGNIFVIPAPMVSVLYNPQAEQNTIYKVDYKAETLKPFLQIPHNAPDDHYNPTNPYGLLDIFYDCDNHSLYASTVFGSDAQNEIGKLVHIDIATQQVTDQYQNIDPFGIAIARSTGEKRLYFGKARSGEVFSLALDSKGNFVGQPRFEFSIEGLGQRGDDRVRRIKPLSNGNLQITGMEFYYNLIAPTEKPQSVYYFSYDLQQKKWLLIGYE